MTDLMLDWMTEIGLPEMERRNLEKAALLYAELDASKFYAPVIEDRQSRSIMNITFTIRNADLTEKFIEGAAHRGIINIRAHHTSEFGGFRVSLYNAMPVKAIRSLIGYMRDFELRNTPEARPLFLKRLWWKLSGA